MVTTAQSLGDDLPSLEANLVHLMEERFADEDGYYRGEINARSMRPYESNDGEILPPEKQWARRGLMPEEAMAVHMNYEDASMTTGNYVQALIAKFEKTGDPETRRILQKAFEAMSLEKEGNIPSWEGTAEPCINVQNLMTESLVPLMDRFPERRPAMVKRLNWWWRQANECQLQPDGSSMHHAVHLNTAPLSACTYVQICEVLEPGQQPMDIDAVLLEQNRMEHFMVMRNAKNCAITGWMESRTSLSAQMIAAWLRAYWESR